MIHTFGWSAASWCAPRVLALKFIMTLEPVQEQREEEMKERLNKAGGHCDGWLPSSFV